MNSISPNQTSTSIPDISGPVLRGAREAHHLTQEQLARTLCLSRKHVDQLENGGMTAFFSLKYRYQVALKVADYLGLKPVDIWVEKPQQADVPNLIEPLVTQQQRLADRLDQPIITEPVSSVLPSQLQSNWLTQHTPKLGYMVLLGILIPVSYFIAQLVITQNNLISPAPLATMASELDKKVTASDAPAINSVEICDLTQFATIPTVSVELPFKKGDNLLVVAKSDQSVCVVDGLNKVSELNLNMQSRQVVVGQAPFIINARDFSGLEIYFQGRQVRYPASWQGPIRLTEGTLKEVVN